MDSTSAGVKNLYITPSLQNKLMRKLRYCLPALLLYAAGLQAQPSFPVNGVAEHTQAVYALTNATIVKDPSTTLKNATLLVRNGTISAVGSNVSIPADAVVIDCKGKFIYPAFIDVLSDYGMPARPQAQRFDFRAPAQLESNAKGAFGWNQALKASRR